MGIKKRPKVAETPKPQKAPKWCDEPHINGDGPLSWKFSQCDRDGPFSWRELDGETAHRVMSCLAEFEAKSWTDLEKTGSHPIECYKLEKPARDRLVDIEHDDLDSLMSFRISGSCRVWCIQDGSIMRVLWWDPEHEAYLVPKDRGDRKKRHRRR